MKIIGAIMEVNPFHNGHKHFLNSIDKDEDDILIVIISATLMQRGEFCCIDKRTRTELLLNHNVDIVLELPSVLASQGGLYFAKHALHILEYFKITDLYFGSETDDINKLQSYIPSTNNYEKGIYKNELSNYLSNEILGISYLRNLSTNVTPHLIKRIHNNYNDTELNETLIQSATTIRNNLDDPNIAKYTPNNVINNINIIDINLVFLLFVNALNKINKPLLLDPQLELVNKAKKILTSQEVYTYNEFLDLASDKNNSKHKINRFMQNVIFNIQDVEYDYYYRVLGFNEQGHIYLKNFDFITSLKSSDSLLVQKEIEITKVYKYLCKNSINLDFTFPVMPHIARK